MSFSFVYVHITHPLDNGISYIPGLHTEIWAEGEGGAN